MSALTSASILVVDDDRRVVELLSIALGAYGFRVLQAGDGEEALKIAQRERPDLVVLDVRLPRKSGFEVCERLRQDPEDPHVPIIMVSAAAETESRLQGLARGADDYVSKPFSPKELIARIRRLLARAAESRDARRRGQEAEQELQRARDDAKRSHAELRSEQHLRELTQTFVRAFHGVLDVERLAARLLLETEALVRAGMCALFRSAAPGEPLRLVAVRGEMPARLAPLEIPAESETAALLCGLGRPVRLRELDRFLELRQETAPFAAAGFVALAPMRGPDGIEGVLGVAERLDGRDLGRHDLEIMEVLAETAALALHNARRCREQSEVLLETLSSVAAGDASEALERARSEAARWCGRAASSVRTRERELLMRAVRLGSWAWSPGGRSALERAAERDPSGWCAGLLRLFDVASDTTPTGDESPEERRAAALLRAALAYTDARIAGLDPARASREARARAGSLLDDFTRGALG